MSRIPCLSEPPKRPERFRKRFSEVSPICSRKRFRFVFSTFRFTFPIRFRRSGVSFAFFLRFRLSRGRFRNVFCVCFSPGLFRNVFCVSETCFTFPRCSVEFVGPETFLKTFPETFPKTLLKNGFENAQDVSETFCTFPRCSKKRSERFQNVSRNVGKITI